MPARQSVLNHGLGIAPDIDAHSKNYLAEHETGQYIAPMIAGLSTLALTANRLYACPFFNARARTFDRVGINVTVTGAATTVARLGLYNVGANLAPGTLVTDYGTVAVDATAVAVITVTVNLPKGWYYLALVTDGTPTVVRQATYAWTPLGIVSTNWQGVNTGHYRAFNLAALPDPWGTPDAALSSNPLVTFRVETEV